MEELPLLNALIVPPMQTAISLYNPFAISVVMLRLALVVLLLQVVLPPCPYVTTLELPQPFARLAFPMPIVRTTLEQLVALWVRASQIRSLALLPTDVLRLSLYVTIQGQVLPCVGCANQMLIVPNTLIQRVTLLARVRFVNHLAAAPPSEPAVSLANINRVLHAKLITRPLEPKEPMTFAKLFPAFVSLVDFPKLVSFALKLQPLELVSVLGPPLY